MEPTNRYFEGKVELRSIEGGQDYIEGYGIVFNKRSHVLSDDQGNKWTETILPDALRNTDFSDVIGRAEHENRLLLGRTKSGTMSIKVDEIGAFYSIKNPNTTAGKDTREYITRGDMTGSSFAFAQAKSTWERTGEKTYHRTITDIPRIYDMGPVVSPAYPDTTTRGAGLKEFIKEMEEKEPGVIEPTSGLDLSIKIERLKT